MAKLLAFRDGGKTDEKGISRHLSQLLAGNTFSGLQVTQQSPLALGVTVSAGDAMVDSGNGYPYMPWSDATTNVTLSTADGTNPRYDLIVAYIDLTVVSSVTPNNPNAFIIAKVNGTPAGSPVEPNDTAIHTAIGASNPYIILARVTVGAGVTTVTNSNIVDRRTLITTNVPSQETASGGFAALGYAPSAVTYLGNRYYSLTFSSVDLTSRINSGMKFKMTRTTSSPSTSTSLNGTNQYFSRTSTINGMTFTDDFTVSAWIKLSSYTGSNAVIVSRYNGTSGWYFTLDASGRPALYGHNASASNYSGVKAYQSIPLNKWVHVAGQLDMSAFTATTTTSYLMMDGLNVQATVDRAGTSPTALIQAGNLAVGATGIPDAYFPGKIAQAAIFSAKVSQSTMQGYISQGLLGSEPNLISAYNLSGSVNDLNVSNANNITAQNSATTTNADGPFGGQASGLISSTLEYGEVMTASYVTDTTVVVRATEVSSIPTSGGVSAVSYSYNDSPYGMPRMTNILGKAIINTQTTSNSSATSTNILGLQVPLPNLPPNREIEIKVEVGNLYNNGADVGQSRLSMWDGDAGSGTQLNWSFQQGATSHASKGIATWSGLPSSLNKTFNAGLARGTGGTAQFDADVTTPATITVRLAE